MFVCKAAKGIHVASGAVIAGSVHMRGESAFCKLCQHERLHSRYTFQTQHRSILRHYPPHHTFLLCCMCVAVCVEFA